jgi:hypothetical protein
MITSRLKFKIFLLDILSFPINSFLYPLYRYIIPIFLSFYLSKKTNSNLQVFIRQGLINKFIKFNFLFSDLDIGIIVDDNFDETKLKQTYYQLKKYIKFLGEIEVYTSTEYDQYSNRPKEFLDLYCKIRKTRQLNWLRGRLKEQPARGFYHRLKDHRKILILKSELKIKSSYNAINSILWDLKNYTQCEFKFKIDINNVKANNVYCNYLSQSISLNDQSINKFFLLAAMPTKKRGHLELDKIMTQIRLNNPQVEQIFLQLNEYELLIAKAFIRGAANHELWHKRWLIQLEEGIKRKLDHPYCQDAFSRMRITSEGDVFFCCYQRQHPLGNLQFQSLEEIKNSPLARDIKESIIKGEMHKTCQVMACPHAYKERHATSTEVIKTFLTIF